jgi:hypothetical protein
VRRRLDVVRLDERTRQAVEEDVLHVEEVRHARADAAEGPQVKHLF